MKVYLAKSNRANPDTVMALRQELIRKKIEIVEYSGGPYSHDDLKKCDLLIIVSEKIEVTDKSSRRDDFSSVIGKGLAGQIQAFQHFNKTNPIYFYIEKVGEYYSAENFERLSGYILGKYVNFTVIDANDYVNHVTVKVSNPIGIEKMLSNIKFLDIVESKAINKSKSEDVKNKVIDLNKSHLIIKL